MRVSVRMALFVGVAVAISIDDLVYTTLPAETACVRLLTRTGQVGCGVVDSRGVLYDVDDVVHGRVYDGADPVSVLMPYSALNQTTVAALRRRCTLAGILLHSLSEASPSDYHSPAEPAPFDYMSPRPGHAWNPSGANLTGLDFDFAVVAVADQNLATVTRLVDENRRRVQDGSDPRNQAQFNFAMDATGDSVTCLRSGSCLPLGGFLPGPSAGLIVSLRYSVWASRSKLELGTGSYVAAIAQMDASAFIHAHATGANSAMSGLLALLGASEAVSRVQDLNLETSSPQILFIAFNGEFFDLIGSRSFVKDVSAFACESVSPDSKTQCLSPYRIDTSFSALSNLLRAGSTIIDVSQVGTGRPSDPFYYHTTSDSLRTAIGSVVAGGTARVQSASNVADVGLPPTSAWSFPSPVESMVLAGFDAAFDSLVYGSELDANFTQSSIERICSASTIVTRLVLARAGFANLSSISANCTLIQQLSNCVGPQGFDCDIAQRVVSESAIAGSVSSKKGAVSHYPSVYQQRTASQVTDTPRFIHDWWTSLNLYPHYHDAVDPDLNIGSDGFWKAKDGPGRLWTESNWLRQRVRLYVTEAPWAGSLMLGLGCVTAVASVASSYYLSKAAVRTTIKLG